MNIWYFHPYGSAPGYGKYLRPYYLGIEWQNTGHSVTVFVSRFHHLLDKPEPLPAEFTVGGVNFITLNARQYSGNSIGRFLNMMDFCLSILNTPRMTPQRPDVVIVSSPHPFGIFSAWWLAKRQKAKLVFEVRDIWPLSITEMTGVSRWHPITILSWFAERFAYQKADLLASLLGNAEAYMRSRGLRGNFVHVPNGIAREMLSHAPQTPHGQLASNQIDKWRQEGRLIVVHPGTQGYPSALDVLLRAVAKLPVGTLGVMLVGGGDTTGSLRTLASELQLDECVSFVPPVPKAEAIWLTAQSDIGYAGKRNFRSVFRHGISFNKIIDFMQVGIPIILPVTAEGDPVSMSGCGIVTGDDPLDVSEGLRKLMEMTPDQRSEMGRRGRLYAQTALSFANIADDYEKAIVMSGTARR